MKVSNLTLIFIGMMILTISCTPKSYEKIAQKDSKKFFKNIDNTEKLLSHPMISSDEFPKAMNEQLKRKGFERIQGQIKEMCGSSKDYKLLNSYRRIGDEEKKFLAMEYEFCSSGIVIMSYEVLDESVTLFSVWPMKKEERRSDLFTKEKSW
jgi:hypothetical protein